MATSLGFQWGAPAWFWLMPLLALAAYLAARRQPYARFASALPWATQARGPLPRGLRGRLVALPAWLELLALACCTAALAQPREVVPAPPSVPGRDLLLCLDTSSSMAADDLAPGRSRLEVGKALAADFVRTRSHDRVGFVAFARYADLRCPPTRDHAALLELLAPLALVAKEGPEDATAIGAATLAGAASLRRSAAKGRVLVLVTDGEENVATAETPQEIAPLHAAQFCREAGIRVHTIVVGKGSQRADGSFAPLDTTAVRQLAEVTGGRAFVAGDAEQLAGVYRAIDALEPVAFEQRGVIVHEWFPVLIGVGLALLLVAQVVAATWLRRLP